MSLLIVSTQDRQVCPTLKQVESKLRTLIQQRKSICVALLDSENITPTNAAVLSKNAESCGVSAILVGGSTAVDQIELNTVVSYIKQHVTIPVILFPGNVTGISPQADAILFSCLMNSDNPYFITQAQALGALAIRKYEIEAIPMAYLIVGEGGAAGFIGRSRGIPSNKPGLAVMYALAAKYFGMRFLYLEAGSGADGRVSPDMITAVRKEYDGILLVGGGIKSPTQAKEASDAGADIIVLGSILEKTGYESVLRDICQTISH
jgi:phosphoglycerol geranylgeranyltransferase